MTNVEFSNEFETLIQAQIHQHDFGTENILEFDEYEKSMFLTKAQEQLVVELYTGKGPVEGFEQSEEARRYLFPLVAHAEYEPRKINDSMISDDSYAVTLDEKVMFILFEQATFDDESLGCKNGLRVEVYPIEHDAIHTALANPFRTTNDHRVLRVDSNIGERIIELISKYNISKYRIRFLTKPTPIILTDLGDLSIDGVSKKSECSLSPILHRTILEKAVRLALQSKSIKMD